MHPQQAGMCYPHAHNVGQCDTPHSFTVLANAGLIFHCFLSGFVTGMLQFGSGFTLARTAREFRSLARIH